MIRKITLMLVLLLPFIVKGQDTTVYNQIGGGMLIGGGYKIGTFLSTDCDSINITLSASISPDTANAGIGGIDLTVGGNGASPYRYYWIPIGAITEDITNQNAGCYAVIVNDADGCATDSLFEIPNYSPTTCVPFSIASAVVNETNGLQDGSITLTVSGNNTPYTFAWSSGETTQNISGKAAGVYMVTITSDNSCDTTLSYTINAVTDVCAGVTISSNAVVLPDTSSRGVGSIDLTVGGNGFPPYTYTWSNGASTQDIYSLPSNSYTVTISDANGCIGARTYKVRNYIKPVTFKGSIKVINGVVLAPDGTLIITK